MLDIWMFISDDAAMLFRIISEIVLSMKAECFDIVSYENKIIIYIYNIIEIF